MKLIRLFGLLRGSVLFWVARGILLWLVLMVSVGLWLVCVIPFAAFRLIARSETPRLGFIYWIQYGIQFLDAILYRLVFRDRVNPEPWPWVEVPGDKTLTDIFGWDF